MKLRQTSRRARLGIGLGLLLAAAVVGLGVLFRAPEHPMLPYGELRVGIDPSYPPFGLDLDGELLGLDIDLATALAGRLEVPLRLVPLGYDGLYDALKADQLDVLLSALRVDPGRMGDVHYTTGYFAAGQGLVSPPDSGLDGMPAMDGRVIAVEFGSEGDQTARTWQRRLHALEIQPCETAAAALEAVRSRQADAALVDAISARLWQRDHPGLVFAPEYVTHDPYAAAVRPDNLRLWEAIDAAIQAMHADGTLENLLSRWL